MQWLYIAGTFTLAPPGVVHAQQQQGIFSPTSTGIQSPVQILGEYCVFISLTVLCVSAFHCFCELGDLTGFVVYYNRHYHLYQEYSCLYISPKIFAVQASWDLYLC